MVAEVEMAERAECLEFLAAASLKKKHDFAVQPLAVGK